MGDQTSADQGRELEKDAPFPLTDVDKWVLSQKDEDFHLHDWHELREIIGELKISPTSSLFVHLLKCLLPQAESIAQSRSHGDMIHVT